MTHLEVHGDYSLREVASMLWARSWWILLSTIGGMSLALAASAFMPPIYRVELSLVAGPQDDATRNVGRPDLARILGTWLYALGDAGVRHQAEARLRHRYDADSLRAARVSVRPVDNSMVVVTTVRAATPELAADLAQALFDAAAASDWARPYPASQLSPPQRPGSPESPKTRRNLVLGAGVGLLLGTAFAFLLADLERYGWGLPPRLRRSRR